MSSPGLLQGVVTNQHVHEIHCRVRPRERMCALRTRTHLMSNALSKLEREDFCALASIGRRSPWLAVEGSLKFGVAMRRVVLRKGLSSSASFVISRQRCCRYLSSSLAQAGPRACASTSAQRLAGDLRSSKRERQSGLQRAAFLAASMPPSLERVSASAV